MNETHYLHMIADCPLFDLMKPFAAVERNPTRELGRKLKRNPPKKADSYQTFLADERQHVHAYDRDSDLYTNSRYLNSDQQYVEIDIVFELPGIDPDLRDSSQAEAVLWFVQNPAISEGAFICEVGTFIHWTTDQVTLNSNSFYVEEQWQPFYVLLHLEEAFKKAEIEYTWKDLGVNI